MFLAEQRAATIRNRSPIRTQLGSQMMTYLKHVGNKKHSDLKNKTFEEIQALYEKVKRFDESFTVISSNKDERKIKEMNEELVILTRRRSLSRKMVLNLPCFIVKSWLVQDQTVPVQKQTAFGKDKSNPLIVDSLLKTIRLSIHLVVYNKELAIPEQTATGKGISNPLMAGSLPKTTKPT
ncbi:hypothetical protein Tco_0335093 [Tanacetum coccineum]